MKHDEIVAKMEERGFGGPALLAALYAIECAGLTIIPAVADEAEVERVAPEIARQLLLYSQMAKMPFRANDLEMAARAAAAAVREGGKP